MLATVRWKAPTHYTNGEPITRSISYDLFRIWGYRPEPVITGIRTTEFVVKVNGPTECFYVRAVVDGVISAGSNIICKVT